MKALEMSFTVMTLVRNIFYFKLFEKTVFNLEISMKLDWNYSKHFIIFYLATSSNNQDSKVNAFMLGHIVHKSVIRLSSLIPLKHDETRTELKECWKQKIILEKITGK